MPLFIQDEPFTVEIDPMEPEIQRVEIRLRIALTEPIASTPPESVKSRVFVLDTAADYASIFPDDLVESALPAAGPLGGLIPVILWDGSQIERPMRDVTLWLYSNLPELENHPYRIDLNGGVVVLPTPASQVVNLLKPLLGMNALLDGNLRVELNCRTRHFSIWIPD